MIKNPKVISIVDCFVHDETVENNLRNCLIKLRSEGHDVLLVSNTKIKTDILEMANYHFYDSRNQLFTREYSGISDVDFWFDCEFFKVHNIKSGLQKHGLSVLVNLFNSLRLAKSLGYTHFQRFETDDILGPISLEWIMTIPMLVESNNSSGLFYVNPNNSPPDASFHYFYCEIDYFLKSVKNLSSEEDYIQYLMETQGNMDFKIAEVFLYDHIIKMSSEGRILVKDGTTHMRKDFPDTIWNTVSSASNLPEKYKGCVTGIYRAFDKSGNDQDFFYLYSYNYINIPVQRRISVETMDANNLVISHNLSSKGSWSLHIIPKNTLKIMVYEGDDLIFSEDIENIKSYIEQK